MKAHMNLARFIPLPLLLAACSSPETEPVELEAPDVKFKKAAILAAVAPENRKEVEDFAVAEIKRRRPKASVIATWPKHPNLEAITEESFREFLEDEGIDLVVTIVPFVETVAAGYNELSDVAGEEIGLYVEDMRAHALAGRFGVQVVGWNVETKEPVYARTSQILVGEVAGPQGVAEFAVESVTRDL
jgi:hypothetical protein